MFLEIHVILIDTQKRNIDINCEWIQTTKWIETENGMEMDIMYPACTTHLVHPYLNDLQLKYRKRNSDEIMDFRKVHMCEDDFSFMFLQLVKTGVIKLT